MEMEMVRVKGWKGGRVQDDERLHESNPGWVDVVGLLPRYLGTTQVECQGAPETGRVLPEKH